MWLSVTFKEYKMQNYSLHFITIADRWHWRLCFSLPFRFAIHIPKIFARRNLRIIWQWFARWINFTLKLNKIVLAKRKNFEIKDIAGYVFVKYVLVCLYLEKIIPKINWYLVLAIILTYLSGSVRTCVGLLQNYRLRNKRRFWRDLKYLHA